MKNKLITGFSCATLALLLGGCATGEGTTESNYPAQDIELIVGFSAGGHNDATARQFASLLEAELGNTVVVVNREGGGGVIASTEVANSSADGHTLLFGPSGAFSSGMIQQDVSYGHEDFQSIQYLSESPFLIVTPSSSEISDISELQETEDRLSYATFGEGHSTHLIGAGVIEAFDLHGEVASFPGGPPAVQAIVNGEVDFGVVDIASVLPQIQSGDVDVLAVSSESVPEALDEDIPTLSDLGLEEYAIVSSQALVAPAGIPDDVQEVLNETSQAAVAHEDYAEFLDHAGITVPGEDGSLWMDEQMPGEYEHFQSLYEDLGL